MPNGDFVVYLRALLALPAAADYFPDLAVDNGRICRATDDGLVALESDLSTEPLLDYLNPTLREVEDTEVIQSAKLVHWAQNDPAHRALQIELGVKLFQDKMARYAQQYRLHGQSDAVCAVVADTRHQGRAKSVVIMAALQQPDPLGALLKVGEPKYANRLQTLRREVNRLLQEGTFGRRRYDANLRDFV